MPFETNGLDRMGICFDGPEFLKIVESVSTNENAVEIFIICGENVPFAREIRVIVPADFHLHDIRSLSVY